MTDISRKNIMVVDDVETNIDILVEALSDEYDVSVAMDGVTALEDIRRNIPDLVLLDVMMPGMDGYEVCKKLKGNSSTKNIPVIFLTAKSEVEDEAYGLSLGAVDFIAKPFNSELVKARLHNHLELKKYRDSLEEQVRLRTEQLEINQEITIECMAAIAEYRDPETGAHIKRIQNYVKTLAEKLASHPRFRDYLTPRTIEMLVLSAPLHDIGKVGIRDSILLKPGKLTEEEYEIMKDHTTIGRDAIAVSVKNIPLEKSFLKYGMEIAISHHEKWNGKGYPYGLKGEEIPISGRLMALADVYDALVTKRVYKSAFSHEKARNIILEGRGEHFDPDIVDAFIETEAEFIKTSTEFLDEE